MPAIIIHRKKSFVGFLRSFKVVVDGRAVATVENGGQARIELTPGVHELKVKAGWSSSSKIKFILSEEKTQHFVCCYGIFGPKLDEVGIFTEDPPKKKSGGLDLDMTLEFNWQTVVVFLLLLGSLGIVGLRSYAFIKLSAIKTVDHLAFSGKEICVQENGALYFLTPEGELNNIIPLADLGIGSTPDDIEFAGPDHLLIGSGSTIFDCDLGNRQCDAMSFSWKIAGWDNYKFAYDEAGKTIYAANTNRHKLLAKSLDGDSISTLPETDLSYPNDLLVTGGERLLVADTKNSRIKAISLSSSGHGYEGRRTLVSMKGEPQPRPDSWGAEVITDRVMVGAVSSYPSPLSLAESPDGSLWVVVADAYINYGEIWKFSPAGRLLDKIKLSEKAIPLDIIRVNDRILVSDSGKNLVYSINPDTSKIDIFGNESFREFLAGTIQSQDVYRQINTDSLKWIAVLLVGLILMLVVVKSKR